MLPAFHDIYFLIAFKILTMIGENTMFTASSIKKFIPIILAKMYVIVLVPPAHVARRASVFAMMSTAMRAMSLLALA